MKLSRHHAHVVTFGATVAALTLAIPGTASAQRGAGGGGGFFNNPAMRLWGVLDQGFDDFNKELSLSEEQTEAVTKLVTDFREENKNALGRWTNMRNSMRSRTRGAGGGGARGAGGGRQSMQEIRDLMRQLTPALETLHEEVTKLLDEKQVETLARILERPPRRG